MIINGSYTHVYSPLTLVARASLINIDGKYRKPYLINVSKSDAHTARRQLFLLYLQ